LRARGDATAEPSRPAPLRQPAEVFSSQRVLHPVYSPHAFLETTHGTIELELNVVDAPLTTQSFMELARGGFYNGIRVHRLVPGLSCRLAIRVAMERAALATRCATS
jgi:hypothetical protein